MTPAQNHPLFVEIVHETFCGHIVSSSFRPATPQDIAEVKLSNLRGECSHGVFYDEAGWMYDFRSCGVCGAGLGAI